MDTGQSSGTRMTTGYIGIDIGTQGLSVICTDENLAVLSKGEAPTIVS